MSWSNTFPGAVFCLEVLVSVLFIIASTTARRLVKTFVATIILAKEICAVDMLELNWEISH